MIDAWTQTDRSDYAIIKSRLKSLNRDFSSLKGAGLYQAMMQKQNALEQQQHHSLRLNS